MCDSLGIDCCSITDVAIELCRLNAGSKNEGSSPCCWTAV